MCRNHSHLVASLMGEDTSGLVPVLMFALKHSTITIESPSRDGGVMILPTSGMLYVPSWILGGSFPSPPQAMGAGRMSLCLLPGGAMTTTQEAMSAWLNSPEVLLTTPPDGAPFPTVGNGATADDDVPW
jgi:hypothetical protein